MSNKELASLFSKAGNRAIEASNCLRAFAAAASRVRVPRRAVKKEAQVKVE